MCSRSVRGRHGVARGTKMWKKRKEKKNVYQKPKMKTYDRGYHHGRWLERGYQ